MEATLSALSIGALIYGIIKSRQFNDSNDIATVIPPSLKDALSTYQSNPNKENLKVLENMKKKEQNELQNVKNKVQEDANRRIAQILQDAKQQAQRMYAQGKLEEAKRIEQLAEQKKSTLLNDTKANLQELGKRFQNTMTTVNTMMSNVNLMSDKDLQKQIALVSNELKTARNNEALLRQQVAQLQSKLNATANVDRMTKQQLDEYRKTLENAKKSAYEAEALRKELNILKNASKGDQNARVVSNQFLDLRRQLDEAKRNEQQLLIQLQKERMMRNSGNDLKLQEMERELVQLRKGASNTGIKDRIMNDLNRELNIAKRREQEAVEELKQLRNTIPNVNYAKQHTYDLQRRLDQLSSNANQHVMEMAEEISNLKDMLWQSRQEYQRLKDQSQPPINDSLLNNAKRQIYQLEKQLANLYERGNGNRDDFKNGMIIADLQAQLEQMKNDKNASNSAVRELQQKLQNAEAQSSVSAKELAKTVNQLTSDLKQAQLDLDKARRDMQNAKVISNSSKTTVSTLERQLQQQTEQFQRQNEELNRLREQLVMAEAKANNLAKSTTNSNGVRQQLEAEVARLQSQIQQQQSNVTSAKQATNVLVAKLKQELKETSNANAKEIERLRTELQNKNQNSINSTSLKEQLNAVKRNAVSKDENISQLEKDLTLAKGTIQEINRQLLSRNANIQQLQIDKTKAEENVQAMKRKLENAQMKPSVSNASVGTNVEMQNFTNLENEIIGKDDTIKQMQVEQERTMQQLKEALSKAEEAQNKVTELESRLKDLNENKDKTNAIKNNISVITENSSLPIDACNVNIGNVCKKENSQVQQSEFDLAKTKLNKYNESFYSTSNEETQLTSFIDAEKENVEKNDYLIDNPEMPLNTFVPVSTKGGSPIINNINKDNLKKVLKRLYEEVKQVGAEMSMSDLSKTIYINDEQEDDNMQFIRIIRSYIECIRKILATSTLFLFTSFDTDFVSDLLEPTKETNIQVHKGESSNATVLNREFVIKKLCQFIYVDVTHLSTANTIPEYASLYKIYIEKTMGKYLYRDTTNYNKIFRQPECARKYLFVDKFFQCIETTFTAHTNQTDAFIVTFYKDLLAYIALNIPFVAAFVGGILKFTESYNKESFQGPLMDLLAKKYNRNLLTYVKVRNDDREYYNQRYAVFLNKNKFLTDTTLVVKHNNHNFKYYDDFKNPIYNNLHRNFGLQAYFNKLSDARFTVKKYDHEYLFGPFTKVFPQTLTNKDIAIDMTDVTNILRSNEPRPVFLIGYGASGAGKTSTLIHLDRQGRNEDGVLIELCNEIAEPVNGYKNIKVVCYELYEELKKNGKSMTRQPTELSFTYDNKDKQFKLDMNYTHVNLFSKTSPQTLFTNKSTLGQVLIHMIDKDRYVKATSNNPNSSRSHSLIFIKFGNIQISIVKKSNVNEYGNVIYGKKNYSNDFDPNRTLIIGDFAGVENAFNCDDENQLLQFLKVLNKKEKPFYSEYDDTLTWQKGGNYQACFETVREDHSDEFFDLSKHSRPNQKMYEQVLRELSNAVETNRSQDHVFNLTMSADEFKNISKVIFEWLFEKQDVYRKFVNYICQMVMSSSINLDDNNHFLTLLQDDYQNVLKRFSQFILSGRFEKFVEDTKAFIKIIQKESKMVDKNLMNELIEEISKYIDVPVLTVEQPNSFLSSVNIIDQNNTYFTQLQSTQNITNLHDFLERGKKGIEIIGNKTINEKQLIETFRSGYDKTDNDKLKNTALKRFENQQNEQIISILNTYIQNTYTDDSKSNNANKEFTNDSKDNQKTSKTQSKFMGTSKTQPKSKNANRNNESKEVSKSRIIETIEKVGMPVYLLNLKMVNTEFNLFSSNFLVFLNKQQIISFTSLQNYIIEQQSNIMTWVNNPTIRPYKESSDKDKERIMIRYADNTLSSPSYITHIIDKKSIHDNIKTLLANPLFNYFRLTMKTLIPNPKVKPTINNPKMLEKERLEKERLEKLEKEKLENDKQKILKNLNEVGVPQFCYALIVEALHLVALVQCRKSYYKHVCETRKREGKYINDSLRDMREVIRDLMFEKNKSSINNTPLFHTPCLPVYCQQGKCFPRGKDSSKKVSSLIFNVIKEELSTKKQKLNNVKNDNYCEINVLKDLVIGVFCVINLSKLANNPPPVPFIDTNEVRTALTETNFITNKVKAACEALAKQVESYNTEAYKSFQVSDDLIAVLRNVKENSEEHISLLNNKLIELENISAASLIGTLQYVDSLSKFNTTNVTCAQRNLSSRNKELYNTLMEKLTLTNIVDNTNYFIQTNANKN